MKRKVFLAAFLVVGLVGAGAWLDDEPGSYHQGGFLLLAEGGDHTGPQSVPLQCFDCHFSSAPVPEPECFSCHGSGQAKALECFDCHGTHRPSSAPNFANQGDCFQCH